MKKTCITNHELGKRLRSFRMEKGLSIEKVATQIGVATSTYREWESGRAITGNPYQKLASVLGVGVYQILGIEDTSKEELISYLNDLEACVAKIKECIL